MSFTNEDLEEFKSEALDLLEIAEKSLLSLDQGGDFKSAFDSIFRGFHNLKGASGMMEMLKLQIHMHELEDSLMKFKEKTAIPKENISSFLRGVDAARTLLDGGDVEVKSEAKADSPPAAPGNNPLPMSLVGDSAIEEFLSESEEIITRISNVLQLMEAETHKKDDLEGLYRDAHSLKGSAYLFSLDSLGDLAHAMESSLEGVRNYTHLPSKALINCLFRCLKMFEKEIAELRANSGTSAIKGLLPAAQSELQKITSELLLAPIESTLAAQTPSVQKEKESEHNGSIRVSVSLLDGLMTLMGEMVLVRNQLIQFSSKSEDLEFLNLSKRLNVVTSEIQGEMMKTRMQPIGNILTKFNRVVRDLAQDLKKDISLTLTGADTELDKSLLESIKDPLTHIVRNSCDHGIEAPAVRTKSGKAPGGSIHIRAYHEGGQVIIEVSDDGKGLHKDMLLKKALEKQIITEAQAANMGEKEIFGLIFAPGFSTAASVTNVSGRGVGMDVVRTNVERIGGTVELTSLAGKGTTTKLKIPLTLAIVPALIVKCGGETFAIPQVKLEELVRVDQASVDSKIEYLHGAPVYRLRGNILPLVSLNKILSLKDTGVGEVSNIVVLNAEQSPFGLIVDEIQDTADIVVKPINRLLKSIQAYSGATILGDGSIALILDVLGISKVAQIGTTKEKSEGIVSKRSEESKLAERQEFLIVRVNAVAKHAIVLGYVHRLEEFPASKVEYSGIQRVIRYGTTILPIVSMSELLQYGKSKSHEAKAMIPVVVIQKAGVLYGLEVDEIVDTISTVAEVDNAGNKQLGIFGVLSLPEELIVIADPYELISGAFPDSVVKPSSVETSEKVSTLTLRKPSRPAQLQILLAEDTLFFRRAIAKVLVSEGHEVTVAVDGKDAIDILRQNPEKFDLIVSDIEMPRMNGFELAKAVRADRSLASLPMLAISSRADKKYLEDGLKAGFNVYLEKLKPNILIQAVRELTSNPGKAA